MSLTGPNKARLLQIAVVENEESEQTLDVWWKNDKHHARLVANMETRIFSIYRSAVDQSGEIYPVSLPPWFSPTIQNHLTYLTLHDHHKGSMLIHSDALFLICTPTRTNVF